MLSYNRRSKLHNGRFGGQHRLDTGYDRMARAHGSCRYRYAFCKASLEQIPPQPFLIKKAKFLRFFLTEATLCGIIHFAAKSCRHALLVQLDRVTGYESVGRGFESPTAHHTKKEPKQIALVLFLFVFYTDMANLQKKCYTVFA